MSPTSRILFSQPESDSDDMELEQQYDDYYTLHSQDAVCFLEHVIIYQHSDYQHCDLSVMY